MSVVLDLDVLGDMGDRLRALLPVAWLRAYMAAVVGRTAQRAPYGAHRTLPLPVDVARSIAVNDSRDSALLVYVDISTPLLLPIPVRYSSSEDVGSSNYAAVQKQGAGTLPAMFVLLPGDQLYAKAAAGPSTAIVTQEWY